MIIDFFDSDAALTAVRRRDDRLGETPEGAAFTSDYLSFGYDYYDNPGLGVGYGGYSYDGRYGAACQGMIDHYRLKRGDRVLEIGCAKGFVLVEFQKRGMEVAGVDASSYAVDHAMPELAGKIQLGTVDDLPFEDNEFDLVLGKEVLPHVPECDVRQGFSECVRVSKGNLFFEIQCGRTATELTRMLEWDATHQIVKPPSWWESLAEEVGYPGDLHFKVLFPESRGAGESP